LVDRSDQRTLLIASNFLRGIATVAFAIAPNLEILLLLVALKSSVDAVFTPSKQVTLPLLSPSDGLMAANSISHTINQVTKIVGPALGGALVVYLSPQTVFFVNASLSMLAGVILWGLPRGLRHAREEEQGGGVFREFSGGLSVILRRPILIAAILSMSVGFFLIFLFDGLLSLLVRETGYPDSLFGLSVAATGAGGVLGAIILGQYCERFDPIRLMATGGITCGILIAVVGHIGRGDLVLSASAFCFIQFLIGITTAGFFVPYRVVLQRETPSSSLGRVTAVGEATSAMSAAAAPPAGALLASWLGISAPFLAGGYLAVVFASILLVYTRHSRAPQP
jgi:MFS family permease